MIVPGLYNLGDISLAAINAATATTVVTTASDSSGQTVAYIDGLDGMLAASIQLNFNSGSGGGTIKATIETSLDQGLTWCEIARLAFATASVEKIVNLSALTPRLTPYSPVALADDTTVDGILGDRVRMSIVKSGPAYAGNTSLSGRLIAR